MKRAIWICIITASLRADSTYTDELRNGLREVGISIGDGSFTLEHLEQVARLQLDRTPQAKTLKLMMVGAKGGLPAPKAGPYDYESWRRLYDRSLGSNEIAEAIAIGSNAVLLVRDRSGKLTEHVLSGTNPLRIVAGGQDFEIVHMALAGYSTNLTLFLQTRGALEVAVGRVLLQKLQALVPNFEISTLVENEAWFVRVVGYPILNPFVEHNRPLTAEEYRQMKTLSCRYVAEVPECTIQPSSGDRASPKSLIQ